METDLIKLGITYEEVALETAAPNMTKVVLKKNQFLKWTRRVETFVFLVKKWSFS